MTRKPDTPCAGCGKLLYTAQGSLPAGKRRCQKCRGAGAAGRPGKPGNLPGRHGTAWRKLRRQVIAEETNCFRCTGPVDKALRFPHPDSPSVDHVVDVAAGGAPLDRANVRLAHFGCNSADGATKRRRTDGERVRGLSPARAREALMAANRVDADETRTFLARIRDKLATEMEAASGRDSVVIAKELRAVVAAIAELEAPTAEPDAPEPDGEVATGDPVDQLRARREKRRADAADSELPAVHEQLGG
ncbi:hypothetical protein O7626_00445 [Micromonospora sp. WMMD1102]|uniref:hypothetical protein n=1 Tax=Micromonospora sp. WMMD1102 TaxID=3016105 RepID=UPI0024158889|nr:hypothetical protein [Micromonospora sp. WMMD1102]MDG4784342.1 hypothetical protein [Micromonospora sp. WMMD1102]MDG4784415.1 hypothetical protein [Micromonospora sp. WMMD1102]